MPVATLRQGAIVSSAVGIDGGCCRVLLLLCNWQILLNPSGHCCHCQFESSLEY